MFKNDHIAFRVRDLDRAIAFYTETLGMALLFRETDEAHGEAFAFLELEGGNLELLESLETRMPTAPLPEPPYTPHLAIATDDLGAFAGSLAERGVPILKGPMTIPGKVTWLYITDPDNNVIEFVQWLDASS